MRSRGAVSGGLSIQEALAELELRGYAAQLMPLPSGRVECLACGRDHEAREVGLEAMRRIEGASDPADMVFVGALRCPACGTGGTIVLSYGSRAPPDEVEVLRGLHDERAEAHAPDDASVVRDSGWLRGPDA